MKFRITTILSKSRGAVGNENWRKKQGKSLYSLLSHIKEFRLYPKGIGDHLRVLRIVEKRLKEEAKFEAAIGMRKGSSQN